MGTLQPITIAIRASRRKEICMMPATLPRQRGDHNFAQQLEEWLVMSSQMPLQFRGAVAIATRPRLAAVEVAALVTMMRILHAYELEIRLPVRALFIQRHV